MKGFVIKTLINAAAIWVAAWIVPAITLTGDDWKHKTLTVVAVALVFGVVNWLIKPVVKLFSLPLFILTLGLFTFVVNALMLWLTSWASDKLDLDFHVDGFWAALFGALIVSLVSWGLSLALDED
ncbi:MULTISPECIES: phage holin family protein [Streptomycetaceae]|uniref:phage holin family protein n=1 Tax=Streptomycetaceae TaxID=2062 RepID=UPI0004BFD69F|nr:MULTISPECIES: phage holin family protein [Streptomycetaceae]KJY38347.1 membrane protein [Streptomyces sp. NRRL S-495]KOV39098.1 membrane protein [Streptomyces sp. XY431]MCX4753967.1 phage holin family protein [Kitasatospora purpeofusca]WSR33429.1 phage holin family protein [Kitasatospora purpeofusca]WSR41511.1 phage holin family protein [Kitasatospora purpeofusca]